MFNYCSLVVLLPSGWIHWASIHFATLLNADVWCWLRLCGRLLSASFALCFFFDCHCAIASLISAFHLLPWNVPFSETLLCASALLEGLVAEIQGPAYLARSRRGQHVSSRAPSVWWHSAPGWFKDRCRGGIIHDYGHPVMVESVLTFEMEI